MVFISQPSFSKIKAAASKSVNPCTVSWPSRCVTVRPYRINCAAILPPAGRVTASGAAPEAVTLPVGGKIAAQFMRDGLTVTHLDDQLTVHGFTDFDAAAFILENEG